MDFSKFTSDNFDAKEWINDVFQNPEAQNNKEQYAVNLVMKLQLLIQEVAKSLEDTSQQIVHSLPKLKREIVVMQQEADLLNKKMMNVEQEVQKVEHDTSNAMDSLLLIDEAKSRLMEIETSLKEVDNWATLIKDIDGIFASGNPELISERLYSMQQSLAILGKKIGDFQDRYDLLERLKDQFTVAVSPSVVAALTSQNLETAQYFAKMLMKLERLKNFENYCYKVIKADIARQWTECLENEDFVDLEQLFNAFYDSLLSLWFSKLKWFNGVLKNPSNLLIVAFTKSLSRLDPPMETVVKNRLADSMTSSSTNNNQSKKPSPRSSGENLHILSLSDSANVVTDQITVLISLKSSTDSIVRSLESYLDNLHGPASANADNVSSTISQNESIEFKRLSIDFLSEFYRFFTFFVENYEKYEKSCLLAKLNRVNLDSVDIFGVDRFSKSVEIVFFESSEACKRCEVFSGDFALPYLIKALETFFDNYMSLLNRFLDQSMKSVQLTDTKQNLDRFDYLLKLSETSGNLLLNLNKLVETLEIKNFRLKNKFLSSLNETVITPNDKSAKKTPVDYFKRILTKNEKLKADLNDFCINVSDSVNETGDNIPPVLLNETRNKMEKFNKKINKFVLDMLLGPVKSIFAPVSKLLCWSSGNVGEALDDNLPSFSIAPQEYITKIGQYIMTFAHHLEPYLSQNNLAIKICINKAENRALETADQVVRYWLECVSSGVMKIYLESILNINELSEAGCKQLKSDLDYLRNVLDDLEIIRSGDLITVYELLSTPKIDYSTKAPNYEKSQKLYSAVKEMRRIK